MSFDYNRAVAEAAAALTEFYGSDAWVYKVDAGEISMASVSRCIIGQVYGHYGSVYASGITENREPEKEGLRATFGVYNNFFANNSMSYDSLDQAWRDYITAYRRPAGETVTTENIVSGSFEIKGVMINLPPVSLEYFNEFVKANS